MTIGGRSDHAGVETSQLVTRTSRKARGRNEWIVTGEPEPAPPALSCRTGVADQVAHCHP